MLKKWFRYRRRMEHKTPRQRRGFDRFPDLFFKNFPATGDCEVSTRE
jgi:hypothetical protein